MTAARALSGSRWRWALSPSPYASRPEAPASAALRAAPSAIESRPWRWRYAADASVTTAAIIASTSASPTMISVPVPRSSRIGDLLELPDRHGLRRVEREARPVAAQRTRHQRQDHPRVHRHRDHRRALMAVARVRRTA